MNFRDLPKIDKFIANDAFKNLSKSLILSLSKNVVEQKREQLLNGEEPNISEDALIHEVLSLYDDIFKGTLVNVINATGVVIHTNLGRSPISSQVYENVKDIVCGYSDIEYDLESGKRGSRYTRVSNLVKKLFNTEDILIVNNNASAVFLILNTFSKNRESIVSRGELVEIGGSFRVPEVMSQSGAILKEIGTTNKTRIADYENAINENSAILMKVHQSNFTIEGFSESASHEEIIALAKKCKLIDYYDVGSAYLGELPYNLSSYEPSLEDILKLNPGLISFSGDKLFGSVQSGIIFGKKEYIDQLKKNQLLRMLRVDKITLAFLEETLKAYLAKDLELIPTRALLNTDISNLEQRATRIFKIMGEEVCGVFASHTYVGGGTLPNKKIPTIVLKFFGDAKIIEEKFRKNLVIGRVESGSFLLDFRSIDKKEDEKLLMIIKSIIPLP